MPLLCSAGGNAGIAAAYAAKKVGVRCSVFIPEGVSESTINLLREQDADVVIRGRIYLEALSAAQQAVEKENAALVILPFSDLPVKLTPLLFSVMVPAYDNPIIWEGHASMIHEIAEQLGHRPNGIFCRCV